MAVWRYKYFSRYLAAASQHTLFATMEIASDYRRLACAFIAHNAENELFRIMSLWEFS